MANKQKEPKGKTALEGIRRDREVLEKLRVMVEIRIRDGYSGPKALRELADAAQTIVSAETDVAERETHVFDRVG